MPLSIATRIGVYEITAAIGAGGMGEVYKARDTKLQRDVAIKSLPELVANDPDRVARFEREAKVLATLHHQNIAGIYGLEQIGKDQYLILEFIDGQSLAQRLAAGRLPFDDATAIARQILDALEAAHEKGIVHRDIKPANIMLTSEGQVKVLDFGLARVVESDPAVSTSNSPTLTFAATQVGVILGTAAYMAPEQAKGRTADKRSDVWAFGCVHYEMLTGRRVFEGEDVSDTLAAVLRADPDWSALPGDVPQGVQSLLRRCLERDRKARIPEVSTIRFLLEDALARPATPVTTVQPAPARPPVWKRLLPIVATALVVGAVAGVTAWRLKPAPQPGEITRFPVPVPDDLKFTNTGRHVVAISPDGSRIVFVAGLRLNIRQMADVTSRPIQGTEQSQGVVDPVFSPDGQSIAFWATGDQTIKRISLSGGPPTTICPSGNLYGITWDDSGLVFGQGSGGIMRVSPAGGKPEVLVAVKPGEFAHGPQILPGGDTVLFTVATGQAGDRWDRAQIVAQSLKSGERKVLVENGSDARYLPSGHLVYAFGGSLFAVVFDPGRLKVKSAPVAVVEGLARSPGIQSGAAHYGVSRTGTLVFVPGPATGAADKLDLSIVDVKGNVQSLKLTPGPYTAPRISPDGKRIAFVSEDSKDAIIWTYDLSGATNMQRLTFAGKNRYPVWTPDSKRVAFQSDREGDMAIFWQVADGAAAAERLTKPGQGESHAPSSFSPKGDRLLFDVTKDAAVTLWSLSFPDRHAAAFGAVQSTNPIVAVFSPDGRWFAYTGTGQQRTTVYVQPNPPTGSKYQLVAKASDSPHEPTWSTDSKQLFYNPRAGGFESVTITTQPTFGFGNPVSLSRSFTLGPVTSWRNYDVTPDNKFLAIMTPGPSGAIAGVSQQIQIVLNWIEELKTKSK